MSSEDKFTFGQCLNCRKTTALKNGYCKDCQVSNPGLTDFNKMFKDIFGEK